MAGRHIYQGRDGKIRLYDNASHYVEIAFEQLDLVSTTARKRPIDPITATVSGYTHAPVDNSYDVSLYEPSPISFSFWINNSNYKAFRDALSNPDLNTPWQVGNHTWSSTKGRGSIIMPDGTFRKTQPFFDTMKQAVCVESIWTSRLSGSIIGSRWDEVFFPSDQITIKESADFVTLEIQGLVYGNINPINGFTSGTSSI